MQLVLNSKWALEDADKEVLISKLTSELTVLRIKADISQGELANIIGVSRQTYGAIERGSRRMSWNTYLSLILFYEFNNQTRQMLHSLKIFPQELIARFNEGVTLDDIDITSFVDSGSPEIVSQLDEQALRSIKTMIMVEYARCTGMPSDAVVKSFNGVTFVNSQDDSAVASAKAIKAIRRKQPKDVKQN